MGGARAVQRTPLTTYVRTHTHTSIQLFKMTLCVWETKYRRVESIKCKQRATKCGNRDTPSSQAKMCLLHPLQDDLSGSDLPDAGLDDVEIHQLPVEKVEGAQPEPGFKEEGGQPEEQASQKGTYKG